MFEHSEATDEAAQSSRRTSGNDSREATNEAEPASARPADDGVEASHEANPASAPPAADDGKEADDDWELVKCPKAAEQSSQQNGEADPAAESAAPTTESAVVDDNSAPQCWICLGGEEDVDSNGPMIRPCGCRGSQRLCHRGCITAWLKVRNGADQTAPTRAPWWGQLFRYNAGLPDGMDRLVRDVRKREALSGALSLSCHLCGESYAVRAGPLRQLSWEQWKSFLLPVFGMLISMLVLCVKLYTRLKRLSLTRGLSRQLDELAGNASNTGYGMSKETAAAFFSPSSWGGALLTIYVILSIARIGARSYGMFGKFKEYR